MSQQLRMPFVSQTDYELDAEENAAVFMDVNEMQRRAPALFATTAHPRMSDRYSFTNTYDIVLAMHNRGYRVVSIQGGEKQYKKVMVRMRSTDYDIDNLRNSSKSVAYAPELVLLDSHDGSSRIKLCLGVIKFACMNGVIAGDFLYSRSYVHYSQDLMSQLRLDLEDVDQHINQLHQRVGAMRSYRTTLAERILLADTAVKKRWGDERDGDFVANVRDKMLRVRRDADDELDLFTAMNVIQENVLRGGSSYITNDRMQRIRPITQVDRNVHINQALWLCAEQIMTGKYKEQVDA